MAVKPVSPTEVGRKRRVHKNSRYGCQGCKLRSVKVSFTNPPTYSNGRAKPGSATKASRPARSVHLTVSYASTVQPHENFNCLWKEPTTSFLTTDFRTGSAKAMSCLRNSKFGQHLPSALGSAWRFIKKTLEPLHALYVPRP